MTLAERFDPRGNNFDVLRLVLAGLVAFSHGLVMRTGDQPYWGTSTLGDFAVDGFFVVSGFLVTRSWLSLRNFWRYSWHRMLRIIPAFWVCLLILSAVVAPLATIAENRPFSELFTAPNSAPDFVMRNAGLLINQYEIASVFAGNPTPSIVDGSLWTLALEAMCYVVLAGLGLLGVLTRWRIVVPILTTAVWLMLVLQSAGMNVRVGDNTLRMLFVFLLGATACLYAHRVPMHVGLACAAALIFVGSVVLLENYRVVGAVGLAYLLLWLATALPRSVHLPLDLSYGVYIYHWPLQQLLMLTIFARLPTPTFVIAALLLVVPVALASWFAVERPALRRKNVALPHWLPGNRPPARAAGEPARDPADEPCVLSVHRASDGNGH